MQEKLENFFFTFIDSFDLTILKIRLYFLTYVFFPYANKTIIEVLK